MKIRLLSASMLLLLATGWMGCSKSDVTLVGDTQMNVDYYVDNQPVVFDSMYYHNKAGNEYTIERLQYFLSDFHFYVQGRDVYQNDTVVYMDARDASTSQIMFQNMPINRYDSVSFLIGVDSTHNVQGSIASTSQNNDMMWPVPMGGGYHFMKLEGHWKDGANLPGYTMHVGKNGFQIHAGTSCFVNVQSKDRGPAQMYMNMNINKFFEGAYTFNFATDGTYTMNKPELMIKLVQNGAHVFRSPVY